MFEIRDTTAATTVAAMTAAEFAQLRAYVEGLGREGGALYVDAAFLAALPGHVLSADTRAALASALARHDALELEVVAADPSSPIASIPEVGGVVLGAAGQEVEVAGVQLHCVVCRGAVFREQRAQLHSAMATFFDVEWLGPTATCCICARCGYIHWFAN